MVFYVDFIPSEKAVIMIEKIADEIVALSVVGAATGCACYLTYLNGEVPEFFATMAGMIVVYYFGTKARTSE